MKSGIVKFTIPFVFAMYPKLLLIDKAVIDSATGLFLGGYDGTVDIAWLAFLFARVALALYLVSSALSAYDKKALSVVEIFIRLAIAALILFKPMEVYGAAIVAAAVLIWFHSFQSKAFARV